MKEKGNYTVKKLSPMAKVIDDYTTEARSKNTIWAYGAADITMPRRMLREHKEKTGESISFTAFLIAVYARIVEKHKYPMNTLVKSNKYYYIFDEVDVQTNTERIIDGVKKPVNLTIRNAHSKTLREIHTEIRQGQKKKVELTTGNKGGKNLIKYITKLPRFLRRMIIHKIFTDPLLKIKMLGSVGLTAAGMMAKETNELGWAIYMTPHSCSLGIGTMSKSYVMNKEGKVIERESLAVTLAFDHQVIDGGPAARFLQDLYYSVREGCLEEKWCFKSL